VSKTRNHILALAVLAASFVTPYTTSYAWAGAENLQCFRPFKKVRTYGNAIKCKAASEGLRDQKAATHIAYSHSVNADCNAHQSQPKVKVWKKGNRWAYRVTFICAIIY